MKKLVVLFGVLLLAIFVVGCNKGVEGENLNQGTSSLGECLTEKGAKMYGAEWCGHCKAQKEAFGDDFKNVDYVECTEKEVECGSAGITGYPTWIIDGESYTGNIPLEDLASISDCN